MKLATETKVILSNEEWNFFNEARNILDDIGRDTKDKALEDCVERILDAMSEFDEWVEVE